MIETPEALAMLIDKTCHTKAAVWFDIDGAAALLAALTARRFEAPLHFLQRFRA
jgi:hypothetical protein